MIISIDTEKALERIQHPFVIRTLKKLGKEGNFLKPIKGISKNPYLTSNLLVRGWTLPRRLGTRQGHPLSPLLFSVVLCSQMM